MADAVMAQEERRRRRVGDVAPELRTPLTNLRCQLELIQDGLMTPDAARIASLHDEVLHLQRLVEELQDLAIVRRLVELHGGRVWAMSVEREDATHVHAPRHRHDRGSTARWRC